MLSILVNKELYYTKLWEHRVQEFGGNCMWSAQAGGKQVKGV